MAPIFDPLYGRENMLHALGLPVQEGQEGDREQSPTHNLPLPAPASPPNSAPSLTLWSLRDTVQN